MFGQALNSFTYLLLKTVSNYKVEILITISIVTGGYTLARFIDVSPPLSMVVAGLVCSVQNEQNRAPSSNDFVLTFWEIVEDFINVVLFLLIGLGVFMIRIDKMVLIIGAITIFSLLLARLVSLLPVYFALRKAFENKSLWLLTWAGLRGAVSIALALSMPAALHRSELLTLTYIIAVFSIVVQGLTIKPFAERLGFGTS